MSLLKYFHMCCMSLLKYFHHDSKDYMFCMSLLKYFHMFFTMSLSLPLKHLDWHEL